METTRTTEYPQIRYHITYDENLTFKDLEDLIKLIRLSNNDVLQELKISRSVANDLQTIEGVYSGSITFFEIIKKIISIGSRCFAERVVNKMYDRMARELEVCKINPKLDKPVYCKKPMIIKMGEQAISIDGDFAEINITIENDKQIINIKR